MYAPNWDEVLRHQAQQQAHARARAKAQLEQNLRIQALNETAARQKARPWEAHAKTFAAFEERQKQQEDEAARERAKRQWEDFNARLHRYKGDLDPMLEVLGIKSKNPTKAEVRTAYIEKIRRVHPDLGGSEDDAKRVNVAFELLMARVAV